MGTKSRSSHTSPLPRSVPLLLQPVFGQLLPSAQMCCTVHTNHPCRSLPFKQPCLMGLLWCIWPVELIPLYTYFPFPWCFQMGKHDEAWMILKQVHDTNMRAKGEPERVFTVSFTKPLTYKRKNGHNSPSEAQHLLIPSWESPFHCDHPHRSALWDALNAFQVECQPAISIISQSCELLWILFIPGVSLQHSEQWFSNYTYT